MKTFKNLELDDKFYYVAKRVTIIIFLLMIIIAIIAKVFMVAKRADKQKAEAQILYAQKHPEYIVTQTIHCPRLSAYNSEVGQCDKTPWITASGLNLKKHWKEDVIAANHLAFKTKVRIPEYYGDKIFTVEDRMDTVYKKAADVWMKKKKDAINFGVKKKLKLEIVKKNPKHRTSFDTSGFWENFNKKKLIWLAKEVARN